MLSPTTDIYKGRTYAINKASFKEYKWSGEIQYSVLGYWFSKTGKTRGALCYGNIYFNFNNEYSKELDGLLSYSGLDLEAMLELCGEVSFKKNLYSHSFNVKAKSVSTGANMLFGNGNLWSAGRTDDNEVRDLVDSWFNLPQVPKLADEWYSLRK